MDKSFAVNSIVLGMSASSLCGAWMILMSGFAAPLWLPLGAIGVGFVALQELLNEDWFV